MAFLCYCIPFKTTEPSGTFADADEESPVKMDSLGTWAVFAGIVGIIYFGTKVVSCESIPSNPSEPNSTMRERGHNATGPARGLLNLLDEGIKYEETHNWERDFVNDFAGTPTPKPKAAPPPRWKPSSASPPKTVASAKKPVALHK